MSEEAALITAMGELFANPVVKSGGIASGLLVITIIGRKIWSVLIQDLLNNSKVSTERSVIEILREEIDRLKQDNEKDVEKLLNRISSMESKIKEVDLRLNEGGRILGTLYMKSLQLPQFEGKSEFVDKIYHAISILSGNSNKGENDDQRKT